MREQVISVPPQKLITKDNVTVEVDAVVYYKVVDPVKSQFEVQDFGYACTTLAQTNLRNLIGDRTLDETLVARDMINTNLREVLDEATNNWGVKVTRVEVQKIDPPSDITEAMSRQMKAERDKRASILESEGVRQSEILKAEGFKQAEILKAEGDAQARLTRATAEAKAIGDFTVIDREDGSKMWAYRYRPLYTSPADKAPGDANGNATTLQWRIERPDN